MAHAASSAAPLGATAAHRLLATLGEWQRAVRAWHSRRATVAALQSLGHHGLKDLGIDRSEIVSVAYDTSGERVRHHW